MNVVAFIPARGGSTRIPRKNLQHIGSRTLVQRAVDAALLVGLRTVVSTDDDEIAAHVAPLGVEVHLRSKPTTAEAPVTDAIREWLDQDADDDSSTNVDAVVLLNPTSPFRTGAHIAGAIAMLGGGGGGWIDTVVSVTLGHEPAFRGVLDAAGDWLGSMRSPRPRTQDLGALGWENGAIFAFTVEHFRKTGSITGGRAAGYAMPRWDSIDIDTPEDLAAARALWLIEKR